MRQTLINNIEIFLKEYNGFFHSEEEIQLLLGKHLLIHGEYDNVYLEYYVNRHLIPEYPWNNDKKIAVDIVVQIDKEYIPIEIKFKTKKEEFPHFVFGSETKVELSKQGAQNEGCYSFWKDVKRIELFKERFKLNNAGIVLFITNDHSYLKQPKANVQYEPFSIHENREVTQGEFLNWNQTLSQMKDERLNKFPGFSLQNNYKIEWKDLKIVNHKYILL